MFSSEEKALQPLQLNVVEEAATQQRPKRARKPNTRFTEDRDASAELPTTSRKAPRRKRKAVRLSSRKDRSARHGVAVDISLTNDIRFEDGRLVITGKGTYRATSSPESSGKSETVSEDGKYHLEDLPQQMQDKVLDYQRGFRKVGAPVVCGDHVMEPSPSDNEAPGGEDEPTAKRPRPSPMDQLFAAVENIEGNDVWMRPTAFPPLPSEAPRTKRAKRPRPSPMDQLFAAVENIEGNDVWMRPTAFPPLPSEAPRTKRASQPLPKQARAARSTPKPSQQPTKEGTCQRTVGCDKGFRHTGFCRAHKVNSRENRLRRALAK